MALPKINQPSYNIYLHSIKKDVSYRPYTTGEEKVLMMISESKDPKFIAKNIKEIMQNCILDPDVDVGKLASYDVENLLLKIRAKSAGEIINVKYTDPDTGEEENFEINIEELDVTFDDEHEYDIKINEEVGIKMVDLTFEKVLKYQSIIEEAGENANAEITFSTILDCIEYIYDKEEIYKVGDNITQEELTEFVENLVGISKKLYKFIQTRPTVIHELKLKSGKTKVISDFKSFLG
ncbi:MAG: hypothetical protein COA52_00875 [Hyphomicrobiales bacterium]|nr:MAG: hypothetical protein COA52_00875 [Hyphomicrobiales bacterium]